jgi:hypothetical protein
MTLAMHYEAARALAVGDATASRPVIGLTVLYRWGLPAWMQVVQNAPQPLAVPAGPRGLPAAPLSAPETAATILVIASMLLASSMESSQCTLLSN